MTDLKTQKRRSQIAWFLVAVHLLLFALTMIAQEYARIPLVRHTAALMYAGSGVLLLAAIAGVILQYAGFFSARSQSATTSQENSTFMHTQANGQMGQTSVYPHQGAPTRTHSFTNNGPVREHHRTHHNGVA
jgi:hypothetical protein